MNARKRNDIVMSQFHQPASNNMRMGTSPSGLGSVVASPIALSKQMPSALSSSTNFMQSTRYGSMGASGTNMMR